MAKTISRARPRVARSLDLYNNKIILIAIIIVALFAVLASLQQRVSLR